MARRFFMGVLMMLIVGDARGAMAQPVVEYNAPVECPSVEVVQRALERRVEPRSDGAEERSVSMCVTRVSGTETPFVLEITLNGSDVGGTRRISGRDCTTLVDAGIVVAALALGARVETLSEPMVEVASTSEEAVVRVTSEEVRPEPAPLNATPVAATPMTATPVTATPVAEVEGPAEVERERESRAWRRIHLGGWVTGRISLGEAPTATGAVALGMHLRYSRFRTELAFQWLPRSRATVEGNESAGAIFAFFMAEARFCGDVVVRPVVLSLCGGVELGATHAEGTGADVTSEENVFWIAPEVGAIFLWPFGRSRRLGLRIDASVLVPLYRTTFYIEGMGDIYRASPVAGKIGLGLFVNFF